MTLASAWLLLAALIVVGAWPLLPPAPHGESAGADEFSADRALRHIAVIAAEPHPIGSPAIEEVRSYLAGELTSLGLSPVEQRITVPDYFGSPNRTVEVVNLMARIPGSASTGAIVLMAHYDSVPTTPGANDNSAAVATLLEAAHVLAARPTLSNDVILLFTDGEEPAPRYGSTAFVTEHPWMQDVRLVVNLEAVGGSGPSLLLETHGNTEWLVGEYQAASSHPAAFSFITGLVEAIDAGATDFTPFRDAGVPGLHFAYFRGSPIYHSPGDSLESVSPASLQHHGEHTMAVLEALGDTDFSVERDLSDITFFTIGRSFVMRYPTAWAVPLASLAALGVVAILRQRRRKRGEPPASVMRAVGRSGLRLVAAGVLADVVWRIIVAFRPTPGASEALLYLTLFILAATAFSWWRSTAKGTNALDLVGGTLVVWLVFAIATAVLVPAAGYIFLWPTLAGTAALLWAYRDPAAGTPAYLGRLGLVAAPTLILMIPAVDFLLQFAQPRPGNLDSQVLDSIAIVAVMVMLAIELIAPFVRIDHPAESRDEASGTRSSAYSGGESSSIMATMPSTTSVTDMSDVSS